MGSDKASLSTRAFTLGTPTLTAAGTVTGTAVENLAGMKACVISGAFVYGSGGGTATAYVQTSLDAGTTWCDVAALTFTNSTATKVANVTALTPVTTLYTPTDGTLSANSCKDGVLGDRLRLKTILTPGYTASTLTVSVVTKG